MTSSKERRLFRNRRETRRGRVKVMIKVHNVPLCWLRCRGPNIWEDTSVEVTPIAIRCSVCDVYIGCDILYIMENAVAH